MCWKIWFYSSEADLYVVSKMLFGQLDEAQRHLEGIKTHRKGLSEVDCGRRHSEPEEDVVRVSWGERDIKRLLFQRWRALRGAFDADSDPVVPARRGFLRLLQR